MCVLRYDDRKGTTESWFKCTNVSGMQVPPILIETISDEKLCKDLASCQVGCSSQHAQAYSKIVSSSLSENTSFGKY